jgi:hypothetical protein
MIENLLLKLRLRDELSAAEETALRALPETIVEVRWTGPSSGRASCSTGRRC